MPFDLLFIQKINNKYDKLFKTLNQANEELRKTKEDFNQTKEDFNQTKEDFNQVKEELRKTKEDFNQAKEELKQAKINLKQVINEQNRAKIEKKQLAHSIVVGGFDTYNQLGLKPNNKGSNGEPAIIPSQKFPFDPSSLLSYSVYIYHSVLITNSGSLLGIGENECGRISSSLNESQINQYTEFSIRDCNGHKLSPVSAICNMYGTLYMFLKGSSNGKQLVYCDCEINKGNPIFLNIGSKEPVALFGGCNHSAAICQNGEIIFINRNSIQNSPESLISAVSLPDGEKASSVACCDESVFVLSSSGRVFSSDVDVRSSALKFSAVEELAGEDIVCLSGASMHCLVLTNDGRVFGYGSNKYGNLGLGKEIYSVSLFTEISSLRKYIIRAVYAGCYHSLFETQEGKILSCGQNVYDELLLGSKSSNFVYLPTETTIKNGAKFCISGQCLSAVFIGGDPPPNTPNIRIQFDEA